MSYVCSGIIIISWLIWLWQVWSFSIYQNMQTGKRWRRQNNSVSTVRKDSHTHPHRHLFILIRKALYWDSLSCRHHPAAHPTWWQKASSLFRLCVVFSDILNHIRHWKRPQGTLHGHFALSPSSLLPSLFHPSIHPSMRNSADFTHPSLFTALRY